MAKGLDFRLPVEFRLSVDLVVQYHPIQPKIVAKRRQHPCSSQFFGEIVTVHNIRNFDYRSEFDYRRAYDNKNFDFGDNQHLAISIAARPEYLNQLQRLDTRGPFVE